jgi:putative ABC transport system permease protein
MLTWYLTGGAFLLAVISTTLASLYPAWKASRLPVVDALRQNR